MKQIYDRELFDELWRKEFEDADISTVFAEQILREKNNKMPLWMTAYLDGYLYVCNIFNGMMIRWSLVYTDENVYCSQPWRVENDLYELIYDLVYDIAEYYEDEIKEYNEQRKRQI